MREWTKAQLKNLGFTFTDSKSNFLFAAHEKVPGTDLLMNCVRGRFMCATGTSRVSKTIYELRSERRNRWKKLCEALEEILG